MVANEGVTRNLSTSAVNLKGVSRDKKKPKSKLHPAKPREQFTEDTLGMEDVLPRSVGSSERLQQKMGISTLSTEEFQRAISEGLVNWKTIYDRGKEGNIKLVAYALWENGHGNEAENWAQAENLINTIWDKIESHANTGIELNNYLNKHQAELKILL